jgi:hypothetical protein
MARPRRVAELLYKGIGGEAFQDRLAQVRVLREWGEVVGPRVAQVTRAVSVRNGVLTVAVCGAVWKAEIEFLKHDILAAINARLGREGVSGIRLTSGYRGRERKEPAAREEDREVRVGSRERRRIEHAVAQVSDTDLRAALAAAWLSKKRLDERKRQAGCRRCRSCGEYGTWRAGVCQACAIDIMSAAGRTQNGLANGGVVEQAEATCSHEAGAAVQQ